MIYVLCINNENGKLKGLTVGDTYRCKEQQKSLMTSEESAYSVPFDMVELEGDDLFTTVREYPAKYFVPAKGTVYKRRGMLCYLNKPHETRYTIKYNPMNGMCFIQERKTNKMYEMLVGAFVYGGPDFDGRVDNLPGYVHQAVWTLHNYTRKEVHK